MPATFSTMNARMNDISRLAHLLLNGDLLRLRAPLVRDLLEGLSAALATQAAQVLPSLQPPRRPTLHFNPGEWPPTAAEYSEYGFVKSWSQMTKLGLALSYSEVHAFLIGLAQARVPRGWQAEQIYRAAHAFARVLVDRVREPEDYQAAWEFLFSYRPSIGEGVTTDLRPLILPVKHPSALGPARVTVECLLQSANGAAGSLLLAATLAIDAESARLVRVGHILAELDTGLYGVSASFRVNGKALELVCVGLNGQLIDWTCHFQTTTKKRGRNHD